MEEKDFSKQFRSRRILVPILIGLLAASWLLYSNLGESRYVQDPDGKYVWTDGNENGLVDKQSDEDFILLTDSLQTTDGLRYHKMRNASLVASTPFTWQSTFWLFIALLAVAARDIGYMIRLRILTDGELSWRQAFESIMLWEFASAITPSVVGGSGVAIYILNREGLSVGKSTATVMVTAMLDEIFYILMVPAMLIMVGTGDLFPVNLQKEVFGIQLNTMGIFWIGYFFIVLLTLLITLSIFLYPRLLKYVLLRVFKIRFLKRWRYKVIQIGNDIMLTSTELKGKGPGYWLKSFLATFLSWTARYWVVNFLILAFASLSLNDHFMVYARQLVMWVIMLISPTPGSAGVAELAFTGFLKEYSPEGMDGVMAILWRLFTYYPYLFAGAIILPRWLRRTGRIQKQKQLATFAKKQVQ